LFIKIAWKILNMNMSLKVVKFLYIYDNFVNTDIIEKGVKFMPPPVILYHIKSD